MCDDVKKLYCEYIKCKKNYPLSCNYEKYLLSEISSNNLIMINKKYWNCIENNIHNNTTLAYLAYSKCYGKLFDEIIKINRCYNDILVGNLP